VNILTAIVASGLSFSYESSEKYALKDVNLDVDEGDFIIIAGPSGCGKSTLIRAFNGLIPHFYRGKYEGDVMIDGHRVYNEEPHQLFRIVGTVFQEPENQLLTFSVERELAFPLENAGLASQDMKKIVDSTLKKFGLCELRYRSPNELSGGEQQKVAIAAALISNPKILLLDEPTSNLDPLSASALLDLLHQLNNEGMTIVLSEHRLSLAAPYSNKLAIMDKGRLIDYGNTIDVLNKYINQDLVEIPDIFLIANALKRVGYYEGEMPLSISQFLSGIRKKPRTGGRNEHYIV